MKSHDSARAKAPNTNLPIKGEKMVQNPRRISGIKLPSIAKEIAPKQIASPENLVKYYFQVTANFQSLT